MISNGLGQAGFAGFVGVAFRHTLVMTLRRKRAVLAAGMVLSPVLVPLALAFLSRRAFAEDGSDVFVHLVEHLYLEAMAPLLALFFGVQLIGEDVESEMIPYVLTRPIPRSAIVLGRFAAYVLIATTILFISIGMTFTACTALGGLHFSQASLKLLAHYGAIGVLALLSYGTLSMFLGAVLRHPIVVGILLIFGWQPFAQYTPGIVDFFTIQKYVTSLMPKLAAQRENIVVQTPLIEFEKKQLLMDAGQAGIVLLVLSVALLALTCLAVRWREYSSARAVGG